MNSVWLACTTHNSCRKVIIVITSAISRVLIVPAFTVVSVLIGSFFVSIQALVGVYSVKILCYETLIEILTYIDMPCST